MPRDRDRSRSGRARSARYLRPRARLLASDDPAALRARARARRGTSRRRWRLVVDTGEHTGRSPKDKFVVREPGSEERIWWGDVNAEISEEHYEGLREKVAARLSEGDVYVIDAFAGADPTHRLAVRVITESPWHALFAKTLFIDPTTTSSTRWSRRRSCCTLRPCPRYRRRTARARRRSSACTRLASRW